MSQSKLEIRLFCVQATQGLAIRGKVCENICVIDMTNAYINVAMKQFIFTGNGIKLKKKDIQ